MQTAIHDQAYAFLVNVVLLLFPFILCTSSTQAPFQCLKCTIFFCWIWSFAHVSSVWNVLLLLHLITSYSFFRFYVKGHFPQETLPTSSLDQVPLAHSDRSNVLYFEIQHV